MDEQVWLLEDWSGERLEGTERQTGDQMGGKCSLSSFAPPYLYPHGQTSAQRTTTILGIAWLATVGVSLHLWVLDTHWQMVM